MIHNTDCCTLQVESEQAETRSGKINDETFTWLADADQRFGPVFEFIFNGQYYWVPMSCVQKLHTEKPSDLRDLIWLPAEVMWTNGENSQIQATGKFRTKLPACFSIGDIIGSTTFGLFFVKWKLLRLSSGFLR